MNKTIYVNIGGTLFQIEEPAYEQLESYLNRLKKRFGEAERDEIIADIESRIAEILSSGKDDKIVTTAVIYEVIKTIGSPDDISDDNTTKSEEASASEPSYAETIPRRLYRNPNDRVLGGVCSGLAAYFNVSSTLLRLAFFLGMFVYGATFLVYFIMWLIIPKACDAKQMLSMTGGYDKSSGARVDGKRSKIGLEDRRGCGGNIMRFLIGFFALIVLIPSIIVIFNVIVSICGVCGALDGVSVGGFSVVAGDLFVGANPLLIIALVLVVLIPVIFAIYLSLRLIFNFKTAILPIFLLSLVLWISSVGVSMYGLSKIAVNFSKDAVSELKFTMPVPQSGTLNLKSWDNLPDSIANLHNNDLDATVVEFGSITLVKSGKNGRHLSMVGRPSMTVVHDDVDSIKCSVVFTAKGASVSAAERNKNNVSYNIKSDDETIFAGKTFILNNRSKWAAQEVEIKIVMPRDVKLNIDDDIREWFDIDD